MDGEKVMVGGSFHLDRSTTIRWLTGQWNGFGVIPHLPVGHRKRCWFTAECEEDSRLSTVASALGPRRCRLARDCSPLVTGTTMATVIWRFVSRSCSTPPTETSADCRSPGW